MFVFRAEHHYELCLAVSVFTYSSTISSPSSTSCGSECGEAKHWSLQTTKSPCAVLSYSKSKDRPATQGDNSNSNYKVMMRNELCISPSAVQIFLQQIPTLEDMQLLTNNKGKMWRAVRPQEDCDPDRRLRPQLPPQSTS